MDGGDAVLVGELAHKTKPADTASETSSLPEQKGFRGFVLLDTQDFTGEPGFASETSKGFSECKSMLIGYLLHFIIVCPILDTLANRLLEFKKTDKSILFFLHYF